MAIDGEAVRLRALEPEDLDRYLEWLNDPDVTRTLSIRYPLGREAEREIVKRLSGAQSYGHAAFAIEVRETGEHIGTVGLHDGRPEDRVATLGLFIGAKALWGRGHAYDAMRSVLRFAFWEMNLRLVSLEVMADNPRAIALYERLGFAHEGPRRGGFWRRGKAIDSLHMSITRDEFEALHGAPPDLREAALP